MSEKRKAEEVEEIEVKLDAPEPLSKKQKRLEKKGKLESKKLKKKAKKNVKDNTDLYGESDNEHSDDNGENNEAADDEGEKAKSKKSPFGVWIGNLSFDTTKDDIRRFLVSKAAPTITEKSLTRINLPKSTKNKSQCKGFAYVDVTNQEELDALIGVSESILNGRNLLIKNANSFEGRPDKAESSQKNPPSRILFVGNLSFDTAERDLEYLFQHCGEIVRIRMATFEDTGNCKGFAFIDFKEVDSATKALKDKRCKKLHGRTLRMEYGEDRSQRKKKPQASEKHSSEQKSDSKPKRQTDRDIADKVLSTITDNEPSEPARQKQKPAGTRPRREVSKKDIEKKPGLALATAQRAKQSIVESTGKKVKFD